MLNYNKRNRIIISIVISVIILILINFVLIKFKNIQKKNQGNNFILKTYETKSNKYNSYSYDEEEKIENENVEIEEIALNQYKENNWRIFIPNINLDAPIIEGTSQANLKKAVCHFENTPLLEGNICLAAHNRGYKYNFFQKIDTLEIGDIIKYQKGEILKTYSVMWKEKIKETDLSYLKDTKENILTLFTCVENMPEYRLCVQAYEIN